VSGDVAAWYAKYFPTFSVGDVVPQKCFYCSQDISEGEAVIVRKGFSPNSEVHQGKAGLVRKVVSSADGSYFDVQLDSGKRFYFIRADLRKMRESEAKPDFVAQREGE
jgi:hypothetical protein